MLQVDTTIPYGNVCGLSVREDEIRFTAHPHGGTEALWFCFRVVESAPGSARQRPLRLVLEHLDTLLGGGDGTALRPVCRYEGGDWERLAPGAPTVLTDGRRQAAWVVPAPASWLEVAFCYPYGFPEVETLLRETSGYWQADTIGVSQGGRPLLRLSNSPGTEGSRRPGLYLVARQHAGETPGSWVLDGLLRRLARLGDTAPLVWAVPLAAVDEVEQGDYGKDPFPWDLNRAWGNPPMRRETLVLQRDQARWCHRCRPAAVVDLHAPGGCETAGVYGYLAGPAASPEHHQAARAWMAALEEVLGPGYAAPEFARVADYPSRWEDSPRARLTGYCWEVLGACGLSIETPYAMAGSTLLTRECYREIGARLADGLVSCCS